VFIQETPVPEIHAGEDYVAHHHHGLRTLARLMTLSFIDIDSAKRTFRFYGVQVCSRRWRLGGCCVATLCGCGCVVDGRTV
jgi:hypothetical protein